MVDLISPVNSTFLTLIKTRKQEITRLRDSLKYLQSGFSFYNEKASSINPFSFHESSTPILDKKQAFSVLFINFKVE